MIKLHSAMARGECVGLYERWCDATKEKDKRKRYWTYVEKDGGRDEIREDLAETIRSHYDRLERIAFNAFPATFKPDMWAHQYDQQANQVVCKVSEDRIYTTNGPDANLFGLEPNYGCCTANMHQGWPKFATHLWMRTPDDGLAAVAYAPCELSATLGGAEVKVRVETDYPFRDAVAITVETNTPVQFPLWLRIPGWAKSAEVRVGDGGTQHAESGTFHTIAREWNGTTAVALRLPMQVQLERRYNESIAIERGPLIYSLKIGEYWKYLRGEEPHADWEVFPTTPWNYALAVNAGDPASSITFEERPVGNLPFSPEGAPLLSTTVTVKLHTAGVLPGARSS